MTLQEFRDAIRDSETLTLQDATDTTVTVRYATIGRCLELGLDAIEANNWRDLRELCEGIRPRRVLEQISRVVGYWSRMRNWNPSKVAEAKDRGNGRYAVDRTNVKPTELPPEIVAMVDPERMVCDVTKKEESCHT